MKFAIDVSSYDALQRDGSYQPVDWTRSGLDLALIKASEGMRPDPAFRIQWKAAAGLPRIAYHFFRSNLNAIRQAQFFLSMLDDSKAGDRTAVDFETRDGMSAAACLASLASFLFELSRAGMHPLVYTYPAFWLGVGGDRAGWAAGYPLWLAQWPKDTWVLGQPVNIFDPAKLAVLKRQVETGVLKPDVPPPWTSCAIWQFTSRADTRAVFGHPALKKVCDYNAVYMELAQCLQDRVCPMCGGSGRVAS